MTDEERRWIAGIATPKGGPIGPAYGIVAGLQIVTLDHGWGFRPDDSHLIAASPDLLAACEAALRYDDAIQRNASKGESWVEGDDLDALYEDWIDKSRDAVAKANAEPQPASLVTRSDCGATSGTEEH